MLDTISRVRALLAELPPGKEFETTTARIRESSLALVRERVAELPPEQQPSEELVQKIAASALKGSRNGVNLNSYWIESDYKLATASEIAVHQAYQDHFIILALQNLGM